MSSSAVAVVDSTGIIDIADDSSSSADATSPRTLTVGQSPANGETPTGHDDVNGAYRLKSASPSYKDDEDSEDSNRNSSRRPYTAGERKWFAGCSS